VRYFVDWTTDAAHPTLMLDKRGGQPPQPLADDIEDIQFQYSLDTNGDGAIEVWDNNVAGNTSFVRQVRVHLLARSRIPEMGWVQSSPRNLADHDPGPANDGYRRRRSEIVVDVMNSNILGF
jgi:hypothetical protein